jgi:hypothetical protein
LPSSAAAISFTIDRWAAYGTDRQDHDIGGACRLGVPRKRDHLGAEEFVEFRGHADTLRGVPRPNNHAVAHMAETERNGASLGAGPADDRDGWRLAFHNTFLDIDAGTGKMRDV